MQNANAITLFSTTVGKKAALALSGLVLFGFVLGHMLGNFLVFGGPEVFNGYAQTLKGNALLFWGTRLVLLVSVVAHIYLSFDLYKRSLAARRVGYRLKQNVATSYAASVMKFSGPFLLFYILFHLAHFTAPGMGLGEAAHRHTDVYTNFVSSFSEWWVVLFYVIANVFLVLRPRRSGTGVMW